MATNPVSQERNTDGNWEHASRGSVEDMDSTPRSGVPISVEVSTPTTVEAESSPQPNADSTYGYFTTHPAGIEQQELQNVLDQHAQTTPSTIASDMNATGEILSPSVSSSLHATERPVPRTAVSSASIQSADSAVTITAASSAPSLYSPAGQRPLFPNQSYAALHDQQHPAPYVPPGLKQRSSHPGQIYTFASALASQHQTGSRTVGNSPAQTPGGTGLFNAQPPAASLPSDWESPVTPGTYASPFLHFTQRVPPKETHIADVDVDPISGRKLINQYEIIDELGRGTHGKVKLGRDLETDGTCVAIKIVERFSKRRKLGKLGTKGDKVKKEVAILKQARHPNVVALLEVIDDPTRKKVYIVLEWIERGEIQWRTKGPKEICMVEARRYQREKSSLNDGQLITEEAAIFTEAQRRLARQRRQQDRAFRSARREASNLGAWSNEMIGDESEVSDDDQSSRISSDSYSSNLRPANGRRLSRTPSPLPPRVDEIVASASTAVPCQPLTSETQTFSPTTTIRTVGEFDFTGLEGTMYGPYIPMSPEQSRVSSIHSLASSRPTSNKSSDSLLHLAAEVLDSELDPELHYVPLMTQQQARVACRDTLLGLQYLHEQGIVHRDIKPPNLLATKDHRVKISDFGVSYLGRPISHEGDPAEDVMEHETKDLADEAKELAKTVGTPAFYAPELCITEPTDDVLPVTKAIDVWALGVTLFCMLFARTPFVDNEFVVMRQIADEEIYIPRKRLRPVEVKSRSRPSSQARAFPAPSAEHRHFLDLSYEPISDELFDMLKRMLTKDPRKRITLDEVRHHPWVVADIANRLEWLNDTDPARQVQGKKIEVSNEDVNTAVVPLFLDRVRSTIRRVGDRLGFGGSKATGRGRSRSNVANAYEGSPTPSNASSSTNISGEERRRSLRADESIYTALKASRGEGDHPLSRSVAASPELERSSDYLVSQPETALRLGEQGEHPTQPRPDPPERANTIMTTATSMRTVRQSDFRQSRGEESPPPSPDLTTSPPTVDSASGISGMARRILRTVRERSTARSADGRASSSDRGSVISIDTHGEPSLAVSQASAAGQVHPPATLDEYGPTSTPSSAHHSPSASRPVSTISSPSRERLSPSAAEAGPLSRTSSAASISSLGRHVALHSGHLSRSPTGSRSPLSPRSGVPAGSTPEEWQRANDENMRKRILENQQVHSEERSYFDDRTCPPSPDDQRSRQPQARRISVLDISHPESPPEISPTGNSMQLSGTMPSSTSDFGSAVSMSVSNPSIPSVISEASSIDPVDIMYESQRKENSDLMSSGETDRPPQGEVADEGYSADNNDYPLSSDDEDDYDSSSDSDGGLVMSRRRSNARTAPTNNNSGATTHPPPKARRDTGTSARRSSCSGSSNTMKEAPVAGEEVKDQHIPSETSEL